MELKLEKRTYHGKAHNVLIVPYGIETPVNTFGEQLVLVLIVPYGIETPWKAQLRR